MAAIWDAFVGWMAESLHAKQPFRCFDLGDFVLRRDKIGAMEFHNPMFVMSEGFAHRYSLLDRRPKTAARDSVAAGARPVDIDVAKITQLATERLGEVVLKETVEGALRDVLERLGEVCADDKTHGIVTADLCFGKLVSENRAVEFHFLSADERAKTLAARNKRRGAAAGGGAGPAAAALAPSRSMAQLAPNDAAAALGIVGASAPLPRPSTAQPASERAPRLPDPPLQRPTKTGVKKPPKPDVREVLLSHAEQLARKAATLRASHEHDAHAYAAAMGTLRGELVSELKEQSSRRELAKDVALIHQVQAHEKAVRDRDARALYGTSYFPFRTDDAVAAHNRRSNAQLKANLDAQMEEKAATRRSLGAIGGRRGSTPGTPDSTSLEMRLPPQPPPQSAGGGGGERPQLAMQAAIDEAYGRYSDYLRARATNEERMRAYAEEQAELAEQAELLKREEARRRAAEMTSYLQQQMEHKQLKEKQTTLERRTYKPPAVVPVVPAPQKRNVEREEQTRTGLRATLASQVAAKQRAKAEAACESVAAEAEMLQLVNAELRESRLRDLLRKADEKAILRDAWDKQKALKELEATVERA